MIALAARESNIPIYALADSSKQINEEIISSAEGDSHSAAELWADAPRGIVIRNRYFEPTPLRYFTKIITEDGLLDPVEVRKRAQGKRLNKVLRDALKV